MVELRDRDVLAKARINMNGFEALRDAGVHPDVLYYTRDGGEFDIRARMFAPLDGVIEDPATGSANCALAAMLCQYEAASAGTFSWRIAQGVEMGRPSRLHVSCDHDRGRISAVRVGGSSVLVSEGRLAL
jgi:trans-2,3-dihydro-3-hydroxyanthranilate isomerase